MSFANAHGFAIGNLEIQNAHNIQNNQFHQRPTDPMGILDFERASEATHKSSTAEAAPKCNPKTRKEVIGDIVDWIAAPAASKSILWLDGPAGAGKTCIMREVVARCETTPEMIAASYFFSTRARVPVVTERPFVATLAHQLAQSTVPGLKTAVLNAVSDNATVFRDGLGSQLDTLIVKPLRAGGFVTPSTSRKIAIVIDGLDECKDESEREHLLGLLLSLVNKLSPSVVVVISSRPNLDIRTVFDRPDINTATKVLRLHMYDGEKDVRVFYCDEFEKIRTTHHLKSYIPPSWPTEEILHILIDKSSGKFIYPATIIRYITTHPRQHPVQLLEQAMSVLLPATENPLAELDALYTLILHPPDVNFPLMKRLLHAILGYKDSLTPTALDDLFQLPPGTVETAFCDLHSVLQIPSSNPEDEVIRFHHKSLGDFLISPERSGDLYQPPYTTAFDIGHVCIRRLQAWDQSLQSPKTPGALLHAARCWPDYFLECLDDLSLRASLLDLFLGFDPRCSWPCIFTHSRVAQFCRDPLWTRNLSEFFAKLHSVMCMDKAHCLPLCERMKFMSWCRYDAEKAFRRLEDGEPGESTRLAALPQFKIRSGLYPELQVEESINQVLPAKDLLNPEASGYISREDNLGSSDSDSDSARPLGDGGEPRLDDVESALSKETMRRISLNGKESKEVVAVGREEAELPPKVDAVEGQAELSGMERGPEGRGHVIEMASPVAERQQKVMVEDHPSERGGFLSKLQQWFYGANSLVITKKGRRP